MPETVAPDSEEMPDTDLDAEEVDAETDAEPEFYIPTPGGLRGL